MDFSNTCTIGLGSNCEEREQQINQAIEHLSGYLSKCSVSSIYETEAIDGTDAPYMNAVIHGVSPVGSVALNKFLKEWEMSHGRTSEAHADGIVTIDLDLVIFNSRILRPKDFDRHYFNIGYRELLANGAFQDE